MRRLSVRITVGRLMAVVGVAAALLGLFVHARELRRRSIAYRNLATHHWIIAMNTGYFRLGHRCPQDCPHELTRRYHRQLQLKYEQAAQYPWEAVDPDPPEPVPTPRPPSSGRSPFDLEFGRGRPPNLDMGRRFDYLA